MLGLRDDNPPDSTAIKHKEGSYSKRAKPKLAWAEEQMIPVEAAPGSSCGGIFLFSFSFCMHFNTHE